MGNGSDGLRGFRFAGEAPDTSRAACADVPLQGMRLMLRSEGLSHAGTQATPLGEPVVGLARDQSSLFEVREHPKQVALLSAASAELVAQLGLVDE